MWGAFLIKIANNSNSKCCFDSIVIRGRCGPFRMGIDRFVARDAVTRRRQYCNVLLLFHCFHFYDWLRLEIRKSLTDFVFIDIQGYSIFFYIRTPGRSVWGAVYVFNK